MVRSLPTRVSDLFDLSFVEEITIQDYWVGLSLLAPLNKEFVLELAEDSYIGEAQFSLGGCCEGMERSRAESLSIPVETVNTFIDVLEQIALVEGDYQPFYQWTDDYPYIAITLKNGQDRFVIYTNSQGATHVPWAASYNEKEYIIDSDAPMQAYTILIPYLKQEVFEAMKDEVRG